MQPKIELLSQELIDRILDEAFQLLVDPGVKVNSAEARKLLLAAGAQVDEANEVAAIPEAVARLQNNPAIVAAWLEETGKPRYLKQSGSLFESLGYRTHE